MLKTAYTIVAVVCCFFFSQLKAQDTLPRITVLKQGGKVIISWKNTYGATISNINIQRSYDSLKRFTTIGTVLNPMNAENGYLDMKPPAEKIFYRVFVAFEGGEYVFSKSYRPVIDTSRVIEVVDVVEEKKEPVKPPTPQGFIPSKFVFTGKDNNVILNLPQASTRKFSIEFFDENDHPVFQLNSIKEPYFILDKVNFLHSGWFKYNLYDDGVLLEKFKFFIPKTMREPHNR